MYSIAKVAGTGANSNYCGSRFSETGFLYYLRIYRFRFDGVL
jgi:hypothetical protein